MNVQRHTLIRAAAVAFGFSLVPMLSACEEEDPVEDAVEDTEDALDEAAEETEDAVDDAGDAIDDEIDGG